MTQNIDSDRFTEWERWDTYIVEKKMQGIYVIADFSGGELGDVYPFPGEVIYIGMTGDDLNKRLYGFEAGAEGTTGHHSGGNSLHADKDYKWNPDNIYYCLYTFRPDAMRETIRAVEKKMIQEYEDKHGELPRFNSQH